MPQSGDSSSKTPRKHPWRTKWFEEKEKKQFVPFRREKLNRYRGRIK